MKVIGLLVAVGLPLLACGRSDQRLNDAVRTRLSTEPTPLAQLDVRTKDRVVTLTGVVATESERDRVERIVRDMDDVLGVDNRLTIQRPVHTTGK